MAKSVTPPDYLIVLLNKFIREAVAQGLAEQQKAHDATVKALEAKCEKLRRRAQGAEARIAAVNKALGFVPRHASVEDMLQEAPATPRIASATDLRTVTRVADDAPEVPANNSTPEDTSEDTPSAAPAAPTEPSQARPQPSVSGAHLSAEQKRLRSEVISKFHERRKVENVPVSSLGPELGLPPSRSYALYDQWCKETGVSRAKPPPWRRNRTAK